MASAIMNSTSTSVGIPKFDPFNQTFTLLSGDGVPIPTNVKDLEQFSFYNVRICVNFGSQLGATFIMLIILLLLTKADKRATPVFIISTLALVSNFIRTLLQVLYYTSGYAVPYAYFAKNYSKLSISDYATPVAANVFTTLVLIFVEMGLIMQVWVIFTMWKRLYRRLLAFACAIVAGVAILFRFILTGLNSVAIVHAKEFHSMEWFASATNMATAISTFLFCGIFLARLGLSMIEKYRTRQPQYRPMQIIFIVGCQTLVVPVVFSILQYTTNVPELGSNVLTSLAIFQPASAVWASASADEPRRAARPPAIQLKPLGSGSSGRGSDGNSAQLRDLGASAHSSDVV